MKRFTLIDNKKQVTTEYTKFVWDLAWFMVYLCGIVTGISLITFFT